VFSMIYRRMEARGKGPSAKTREATQ
jgi:hypothetical protein